MADQQLSQQRTAHALRHFIMCGALWAIYGPNATAAGSIFSGYALSIGLSEAQIAFIVSLSALAGVSEFLSFYVADRVRNKRRLIVSLGHFEITLASSVALVAFLPDGVRFAAVATLLGVAFLFGHTLSPMVNSWLSNVMPEDIRSTYIGRRMFIVTLTAMVYFYLASVWIDRVEGWPAFAGVFGVGWLAGLMGFWLLAVTPKPGGEQRGPKSFSASLLKPFRDRQFRRLALFFGSRAMISQIAGAFYGVYMIKYLHLSYGRIAIYTNITQGCMVAGYLMTGPLAQRYGSKPIAQIMAVPALLVPLLWAFTTEETYALLIPIACVISGFCISGITVASSALLYKLVPYGDENTPYFASWTGLWSLAAAIGPFVGGSLRNSLPDQMMISGTQITSLRMIFGISAALSLIPIALSALLSEAHAASPRYLLGQFRGNLLTYAYNFALFRVSKQNRRRAQAVRDLGRSGTPLAVGTLVDALEHMSPEVRSEAARALGNGQFSEAVGPLVEALEDTESDIRPEAAEALGKIGDESAVDTLIAALDDDDLHVRISAAMALGELEDERAEHALKDAMASESDRRLFPTLVEAATHKADLSLVEPIMEGLTHVSQPVARMQVLNGAGRVLGEKNHFYRLATAEPLQRIALSDAMLHRICRLLRRARVLRAGRREALVELAEAAVKAIEDDEVGEYASTAREMAQIIVSADDMPPVATASAQAIILYLDAGELARLASEGVVFLTIALTSMARSLAGLHPQDRPGADVRIE